MSGSLRVVVEVIIWVPVGRRHFRNAIDAMFDVRPEKARPGRLREQAADTDNGERGVGFRVCIAPFRIVTLVVFIGREPRPLAQGWRRLKAHKRC